MRRIIFLTLITAVYLFIQFPIQSRAQENISLSISPPIYEVMVKPGKETTYNFHLSNNGNDTIITTSLKPFSPIGNSGSVKLEETITGFDQKYFASWFSFDKPKSEIGESFSLPRGSTQILTLKISVPQNTPEGDYYFTLLFETSQVDRIGATGASSKAKIGSNILIGVTNSGNPQKIAKVKKFEAPKLIDSFADLTYLVEISNLGPSFFKPNGKIEINPTFGSSQTLKLMPFNILKSSSRIIPCSLNENPVGCGYESKFLLGRYRATLTFQTDSEGQVYSKSISTVAVPFTPIVAFGIVYMIIKIIVMKLKSKDTIDNKHK